MKKNNFIPFFVFLFLFFSCAPDCSKIVYNNGISTLNGKLYTGDCDSYFPNGKLNSKQSYKNGKDDGEWVFYYDNENIESIGLFISGKKTDVWKYYYRDQTIRQKTYFDSIGNAFKIEQYDEKGSLLKTVQ